MRRAVRVVTAVFVVGVGSLGLTSCVADPQPLMGVATAGNAEATVSWQAPLAIPFPIVAYVVTPWIGQAGQTPRRFNSTATTEPVTGLTNGTTYTFTVVAIDTLGNDSAASRPSNPVTPTAGGGGVGLDQPSAVTVTADTVPGYLDLSWTDGQSASSVTGHRIEFSTDGINYFGRSETGSAAPAVQVAQGSIGTYWWRVQSYNDVAVSDWSPPSEPYTIYVGAPTNFTVTVTDPVDAEILMTWGAASATWPPDAYELEVSSDSVNWIANTALDTTGTRAMPWSYGDTWFRLRANVFVSGEGPPSNVVHIYIPPH